MQRPGPWQVLSETVIVDRRWLAVHEQRVRLPNGHEIPEFHLIKSPDWAAVLALTAEGQAVLVRQYRHGIGQYSLELPAGVIEPGEAALAGAQRELLEETGYAAPEWKPLSVVSTEPARHTNRAHFFVALGAERVQAASPEQGELIDVELRVATALIDAIDSGEILHGVHVGAILLAAQRGFISR